MISNKIDSLVKVVNLIKNDPFFAKTVEGAIAEIVKSYHAGGKVLFCGNGGSAAEAQHLAAELSGRFYLDRPPIPAEACHVNSSFITAVSNDYDFTKTYSRYIEAVGKNGDVLVGLSTSGNSINIVQAFQVAKKKGMATVGLTGKDGGHLKEISNYLLMVPSTDVPRIQETHLLIGHYICEQVEKKLFGEKSK